MKLRNLVTGVCAACAVAVALPVEASARAGGLMTGRGLMFRNPFVRPTIFIRPGRSLLTKSTAILPRHVVPARRFRRVFGAHLPIQGIGVYYGSGYDVGNVTGSTSQTAPAIADGPGLWEDGQLPVLDRRCYSQRVIVPAEAGGTRPIVVTRCRGG
jgi:hypothetical protein